MQIMKFNLISNNLTMKITKLILIVAIYLVKLI